MKRNVVVVGVVLFALWPAVHRGLVYAFDMNPWKLGGWAMYARPHFPPQIRLLRIRAGEEIPLTDLTPLEQALAGDFVESRYSIGRLASPEELAQQVLARVPRGEADALVVEVRSPYFDVGSARVEERVERREFRR